MAWTYDSSLLGDALNRIRLAIGDTNSDDQILQNEEIEQILTEETDFNSRVAKCCLLICAKLAKEPEYFRLERFEERKQSLFDHYRQLANQYIARAGGTPWAAAHKVDRKETNEEDDSLVTPLFKRGLHDI